MIDALHDWSLSKVVTFLLFLGCWTAFIATPYLAVTVIWTPRLAPRFVDPAVEFITMLFWLASFFAMVADLPSSAGCVRSTYYQVLQAIALCVAFEL